MATDTPLKELRKRGRPKGSKNKKKKRRNDATAVDEAFGGGFRNVPVIENIVEVTDSTGERIVNNVDTNLGETERFGMDLFPIGHEEDEGFDDDNGSTTREEIAMNDEIDDNVVGFGSADIYDVEELIELAKWI